MDERTRNSSDDLQGLREWMAVLISVVILGLSAWIIGQTFLTAKGGNVDGYNRQKDIMLYVVSLFGTVTGYYLGRVPAEVNARRAETAARAAQQQLSVSQEKLVDAAASVSSVSAQLSVAREDKARVTKRLKQSAGELRNVSEAIGHLHRGARPAIGARGDDGALGLGIRAGDAAGAAAAGGVTAAGVAAAAGGATSDAELREAKRRIDALLAELVEEA